MNPLLLYSFVHKMRSIVVLMLLMAAVEHFKCSPRLNSNNSSLRITGYEALFAEPVDA